MTLQDYRERLGIGFSDKKKAQMLANNIATFIEDEQEFFSNEYYNEDYRSFCLLVGEKYFPLDNGMRELSSHFDSKRLTINELIYNYIVLVSTCRKEKRRLINVLSGFLEDLVIPYEIYRDRDGYFIFPKGVPEFDNALVSAPLRWLSAYPISEKAWIKALHEYSESNSQNASDIADLFRKALEAFCQEFFKSDKTLENLKTEYGAFLKRKGVAKEISSNFEALLQAYTNYMNNYAKHRDATSDKVLEYLMYQTGNIMRLLITL